MHISTRLSDEVELGALWRAKMNLEVIESDSGHEDRSRRWSQFLREFEVSYPMANRAGSPSDPLIEVYNAFFATGGGEDSFDFEDWRDKTATDEVFGIGDGADVTFSFVKTYTFGSASHTRRIYRPVSGTVTIDADGVLVNAADYTVDYELGTVTFDAAPLNAVELTWSGSFYVPVRFDSQIQSTAPTTEHEKYDTFTLFEVRLRAEDFD